MKKLLVILLLTVAMGMSAQEVPTFFPRKFLLEHFTSANCNQCPMGMKYIVEFLDQQTIPYIWVSHHAYYGTDEYTIPESNTLATNYFHLNNVPSVVFNRTEQRGKIVNKAWDLETWMADGIQVEGDTVAEASVVIEHSFNKITRRLNVTVNGQVANTDRTAYLLTILIKENRLVGKQADAYTSWKGNGWVEYMHPRVVRDLVTATLGDTVNVENQAYSYSTSCMIDKNWAAEHCCVVAYLTPLEKSPIINAEQVALVGGTTGGEEYGPYGITEKTAPKSNYIEFDSVCVNKVEESQVELKMISTSRFKPTYSDPCNQVGLVYVNTEDSVLQPGTYVIQDGDEPGTVTAGYRVDEEERLGGSRLVYALAKELDEGVLVPVHVWRMSSGEMTIDMEGNVFLNFTTYSGANVTATAKYDFSPATTRMENPNCQSPITNCQKVLRNGQLLIEHQGQWYTVLGYRVVPPCSQARRNLNNPNQSPY